MKSNFIGQDETLDDLELDNLMIIQKQSGYKFSTDSVLLANFAKVKRSERYVDLCSGSGIVAILVSYKNKPAESIAVEIQSDVADMAKRSIMYNKLSIEVLNQNLIDTPQTLGCETIDVITINPPYNPVGKTSNNSQIAMSTHEISINLSQIAISVSKLLKFGGRLYIVYRADRLVDLIFELRKNKLEPKVIRIVYPKQSKEPNLVLLEAKKGAKGGVKILPPLVLNNEDGSETDELKDIYCRKPNS